MNCAPNIWFCRDEQVCVWPRDWTEERCGCGNGGGGGGSTETTPIPTPTKTTDGEGSGGQTTETTTTTSDPGSNVTGTENPGKCYIPKCKSTEERETLFSHDDRTKFWQCAPKHGKYEQIQQNYLSF